MQKQSNSNVLFQAGVLSVTTKMLRFRGRRYKLSHIENLILKRPLFFMGLALAAMLLGFASVNVDLLYSHEIAVFGITGILAPVTAWPFGTLTMHSKTLSTHEGSITWFYNDLAKAQSAIEDAITPFNDDQSTSENEDHESD